MEEDWRNRRRSNFSLGEMIGGKRRREDDGEQEEKDQPTSLGGKTPKSRRKEEFAMSVNKEHRFLPGALVARFGITPEGGGD